jgi:hypothetical protein
MKDKLELLMQQNAEKIMEKEGKAGKIFDIWVLYVPFADFMEGTCHPITKHQIVNPTSAALSASFMCAAAEHNAMPVGYIVTRETGITTGLITGKYPLPATHQEKLKEMFFLMHSKFAEGIAQRTK